MYELKVSKFVTTLYSTFYSNSKAEKNINEKDFNDVFKSTDSTIKSTIQKSLRQDSDCIIDSVIDHNINISKDILLAGSSYIKLPNELEKSFD